MDSSFKTKPGKRPSEPPGRRYFTVEEANRALPLVRRIVSDITAQFRTFAELQSRTSDLAEQGQNERTAALKQQSAAVTDKLQEYAHELVELGIELKDGQRGLVDFPCRLGDREVYLCWKLGEERVDFWHEVDAGFAGRQPVDEQFGS